MTHAIPESSPDDVAELESLKQGELRLRDLRHPDVWPLVLMSILSIGGASWLLFWILPGAGSIEIVVFVIVACAGLFWVGLLLLDELDCTLREDKMCRSCRKEAAMWEGSGTE